MLVVCLSLFVHFAECLELQESISGVVSFSPSTCDQCTIGYQRYWCPIDFSCHFVKEDSTADSSRTNHYSHKRGNNSITEYVSSEDDKARLECDQHCGSAVPYGGGSVKGERKCMDMQMCFYGTKQCSDCIFAGGVWCEKKQKCFAYRTKESATEKLPPIPSDYVCTDNCEGECTVSDDNCSICKRFHSDMTCGSLLPIILISIVGIIGIAMVIACPMIYLCQRKKGEQLANVNE